MDMWFGFLNNNWYQGTVTDVKNANTDRMEVISSGIEAHMHVDDLEVTLNYLKRTKYNPEITQEGAWRQYFNK